MKEEVIELVECPVCHVVMIEEDESYCNYCEEKVLIDLSLDRLQGALPYLTNPKRSRVLLARRRPVLLTIQKTINNLIDSMEK